MFADGHASPHELELKTRGIHLRSLIWQEVVHRVGTNAVEREVSTKKVHLYEHAIVQDILIWAIMSPNAAAAAAEEENAEENDGGGGEEGPEIDVSR